MSDIFISYAREDRPRAEAIAQALEAHGWSVWWDRNIRTGETFRRVIREQIGKARSVVVLWSEHSVDSDWVHEEASLGKRRNILVPVLTDEVELPLGFGSIQTADLTGWAGDAMAPAFRSLRSDIEANSHGSEWKGTSPVRSYPPNAWGLYDMAGNVWERIADWYAEGYYATLPSDKPAENPHRPQSGWDRVVRGGSWYSGPRWLRVSCRNRGVDGGRDGNIGFRCVREVVP
ncbi:MAG: TIR domain-containing protein [Bryobacteraceae bacterium]